MTPELLLAPFSDKGKEVSLGFCLELILGLKTEKQVEQLGTNGDRVCDRCCWHRSYCLWPPEGVCQKSCNHCAAQKIICTVDGDWVANWKWRDHPEGLRPQKKGQVEI